MCAASKRRDLKQNRQPKSNISYARRAVTTVNDARSRSPGESKLGYFSMSMLPKTETNTFFLHNLCT